MFQSPLDHHYIIDSFYVVYYEVVHALLKNLSSTVVNRLVIDPFQLWQLYNIRQPEQEIVAKFVLHCTITLLYSAAQSSKPRKALIKPTVVLIICPSFHQEISTNRRMYI